MKIPPTEARLSYYFDTYNSLMVEPAAMAQAQKTVEKIKEAQTIYTKISIPFELLWQEVGVLHAMESNLDFTRHLANGDPLTADTVNVPKNLMVPRTPPFSFEEAAIAALYHFKRNWGSLEVHDVKTALNFFNCWNGLGEWHLTDTPGLPYLFAGTSAYAKGKFAADGRWDPELISKQVGVAVLLKAFQL